VENTSAADVQGIQIVSF